MLRSLKRAGVRGYFAAIYSTVMPLEIVDMHFDCAGSRNLGARGECLSRLRSRCGAARIFAHGGHFAWQAKVKPRALVLQSRLFVTGTALGEPRSADFVAGTALCEPRSADVVAGTALCDAAFFKGAALCALKPSLSLTLTLTLPLTHTHPHSPSLALTLTLSHSPHPLTLTLSLPLSLSLTLTITPCPEKCALAVCCILTFRT